MKYESLIFLMTQTPPPGVLFYQIKQGNQDNESIEDIWLYNHEEYERGHYFIQWMFPSDEASAINPQAPLVDKQFQSMFHGSEKLKLRLKKSYHQFLSFIGVNTKLVIVDEMTFYLRVRRRNHNLQRITRVLRSLTILGLHDHALAFHTFLMQHRDDINRMTLDYWTRVLDP